MDGFVLVDGRLDVGADGFAYMRHLATQPAEKPFAGKLGLRISHKRAREKRCEGYSTDAGGVCVTVRVAGS